MEPQKSSSFQTEKSPNQPFAIPQRQSEIGVILIFLSTLYKLLRGFWALGAYFLIARPSGKTLVFILVGLAVLGVLVLLFSYRYYHRFLFHIDYKKQVFVLKKGVFGIDETEIHFDKIQQVYTKQSLLQRLIGVYGLSIDTAGSKDEEIEIKAISKSRAEELSEILMGEAESEEAGWGQGDKETRRRGDGEEQAESSRVLWRYRHSFWTLLKIGISTNYFRGLFLILAFFSTIYQEFNRWSEDAVDQYMTGLPNPGNSVSTILILLVLLLIASVLITMIEVFIKYFNLNLKCTKKRLDVEMGLKTSTKISLQPRRVQLLKIGTNPVQKKLDLYEMNISLASSEDSFGKSKLKIPGLSRDLVSRVNAFFYRDEKTSFSENFRPHKILFFRRLVYSMIPLAIFFIVWIFTRFLPIEVFLLLVGVYVLLIFVFQWFAFKAMKLIITENFISRKRGIWNRRESRLETYKMQSVSVRRPFYYRKKNLVDVVFHTAGGDLPFYAVGEGILKYVDYGLFKIESSRENWM